MKITPEVITVNNIRYLIRQDEQELVFVESEKEAKLVVDSFANAEQKRLTTSSTRVFRVDYDDGKRVELRTQSLGYIVNGRTLRETVIDYIPIGQAHVVKGRHSLEGDWPKSVSDSEPLVSQPKGEGYDAILSPDVLETLAKFRRTYDSEDDSE